MASLNVDPLKLYFGGEYPINEVFTIHQPTIGQIMDYGENDFYQMLYTFVGNTTMRKLELWDMGVSWTAISDYELFCTLVQIYPAEKTKILFGDNIDFSRFKLYGITHTDEKITEFEKAYLDEDGNPKELNTSQKRRKIFAKFEFDNTFYDVDDNIQLNAQTYHKIADVLRAMFGIFPKTEYINSKSGRELLIEEQRNLRTKEEKQHEGQMPSSTLLPLISGCVNHPGYKYNVQQTRDLNIFAFMDCCERLQILESTRALLSGMYTGLADLSKVPKEEFDFMREIKR